MKKNDFTTDQIQVLSTRETVQKRPGMYIGQPTFIGEQILRELVGNSVDQVLRGAATEVTVVTDETTIRVSDDGPGIQHNGNFDLRAFTELHTSATKHGHAPHVHLGLHGVGLSVCNFLAKTFRVSTNVSGTEHRLLFVDGELVEHSEHPADVRGTKLIWELNPRFCEGAMLRDSVVRADLFKIATLLSIPISYNDERFCGHGVEDMLRLYEDRHTLTTSRSHKLTSKLATVELAGLQGEEPTNIISWVNGVRSLGGSHVDAVRTLEATHGPRFRTLVMNVVMNQPQFAGPTKDVLDVPELEQELITALEAFWVDA